VGRVAVGISGVLAAAALAAVAPARGSQLIDRNATQVKLRVNRDGQALLTYVARGTLHRVLVVGGGKPYALAPRHGSKQIQFKVNYSGGYGMYHRTLWKGFKNACRRYDGPNLHWPWLFIGCKAPDGSYWAVQEFPQPLPNLGFAPWNASQRKTWLELSHWSGPIPKLEAGQDWVYSGKWHAIFGRLTYRGKPVYGFSTSRTGVPLGTFGTLIYLDTYNSPSYGKGWRRENSFVVNKPNGIFCYGFFTFNPHTGGYSAPASFKGSKRGPGVGQSYRLIASGPGVTPDVVWQARALGPFRPRSKADVAYERRMTAQLRAWAGPRSQCLTSR